MYVLRNTSMCTLCVMFVVGDGGFMTILVHHFSCSNCQLGNPKGLQCMGDGC